MGFLTADFEISKRNFASIILLVSFTFAWFLIIQIYIEEIFEKIYGEMFWVNINMLLFYVSSAIFAIIGSMLNGVVNRRKLLYFWITLSLLTNILMIFFQGAIFSLIFSLLLGFSLGFGFPLIQAMLTDYTNLRNRGRTSGLILLLALIILFFYYSIISFLKLDLITVILLLALLRMFNFFGLMLEEPVEQTSKHDSWISVMNNREMAYYLLPWLMFNIATGIMEWWNIPQTPDYVSYVLLGAIVFIIISAIFCIISGIISDYLGRKQPIILGMILMGISYTILSLSMSPVVLFIYDVISGIAWGFLLTVYLTLPGDLARGSSAEKYYTPVLVILFIITGFFAMIPKMFVVSLPAREFAPLLILIIFLSIVPILRGGETLPDEVAEERKRRKHFEKVLKLVKSSKSDNR